MNLLDFKVSFTIIDPKRRGLEKLYEITRRSKVIKFTTTEMGYPATSFITFQFLNDTPIEKINEVIQQISNFIKEL